jgi:hypothetical protein
MPAAEIAAGITSARAAYDLTKAMLKSRDAKILADGTRDLQLLLGEIIGKFLEAQQAQMAQLKQIAALETEIEELRGRKAEKQRYELKNVGRGVMAYMLKPDVRGAESPHWLCPTCFENGKKSHLQFSTRVSGLGSVYRCTGCKAAISTDSDPAWL